MLFCTSSTRFNENLVLRCQMWVYYLNWYHMSQQSDENSLRVSAVCALNKSNLLQVILYPGCLMTCVSRREILSLHTSWK